MPHKYAHKSGYSLRDSSCLALTHISLTEISAEYNNLGIKAISSLSPEACSWWCGSGASQYPTPDSRFPHSYWERLGLSLCIHRDHPWKLIPSLDFPSFWVWLHRDCCSRPLRCRCLLQCVLQELKKCFSPLLLHLFFQLPEAASPGGHNSCPHGSTAAPSCGQS